MDFRKLIFIASTITIIFGNDNLGKDYIWILPQHILQNTIRNIKINNLVISLYLTLLC